MELLGRHGLACEVVSGAGTGTYRFEAASEIWNEFQWYVCYRNDRVEALWPITARGTVR